ncbi:MAG: hypothetical protein IJH52_02385 [Oscillospiraceae bacterium]|nr:hypothetical protein [Oscillospiraceae bacterium]MBQ6402490.1 hypothetical protein [Oscillospiraceae bacterium]
MVLFTLLLVTVILCAVGAIVAAVIGGGVLFVLFGNVFVCLAIVALIAKLVRRVRCR